MCENNIEKYFANFFWIFLFNKDTYIVVNQENLTNTIIIYKVSKCTYIKTKNTYLNNAKKIINLFV